ncbi:hypothetical protein NW066_01320 [Mycoplasmopsis felis]|uniref:hypothetical protein n=1 Tax=Mycoplasmopsis felis TaxID=33923 RepID=UPI0021AEEAF7|nr:hypothetical protein [Mycoplasmopsis felis]UWV85349.1 hypothetical protein NW066_01320 [Mycoplasmopsis felis]
MIEKFKKVLIPDGAKISKRKNAWYVQVVVKREYIKSKKYYKETKVAVGKKSFNEWWWNIYVSEFKLLYLF